MTYADQIVDLADEGAARIEGVRRQLESMREGTRNAAWIEPVEVLLSMVEEIVNGARVLALDDPPGGSDDAGDELTAAVDELKAAVMDLIAKVAEMSREPTDSSG